MSARSVARRVLARVDQGAYATLALSAEMQRSRLPERDRRLATELCYGVLRHRSRLDRALSHYAHKGLKKLPPSVLLALRVAAYQLLFLDRIPAHAAVDDAVNEVRRIAGPKLAGFANGLLRKLSREGEPPLPKPLDRESVMIRHSMPGWLVDVLLDRIGPDELEAAAAGLQTVAPLSVRVNRQRATREETRRRLVEAEGARAEESAHYRFALQVSGLGSPEHSQSFAEGLWTVQDVAAQLVGAMAEPGPGQHVLDACAGVGGKSTHLAEQEPRARIDAVDLSPRKLELLAAATERLGLDSIRPLVLDLTRDDARLRESYEVVVLDAPCSGLGVLRRHPERKWMSDGSQLGDLVDLQRKLLESLCPRVAPGGHLVYSVCTFTRSEGPEQIEGFLSRHPEFRLDPPEEAAGTPRWNSLLTEGHFESWPHQSGQDAFYAVRLLRAQGR